MVIGDDVDVHVGSQMTVCYATALVLSLRFSKVGSVFLLLCWVPSGYSVKCRVYVRFLFEHDKVISLYPKKPICPIIYPGPTPICLQNQQVKRGHHHTVVHTALTHLEHQGEDRWGCCLGTTVLCWIWSSPAEWSPNCSTWEFVSKHAGGLRAVNKPSKDC